MTKLIHMLIACALSLAVGAASAEGAAKTAQVGAAAGFKVAAFATTDLDWEKKLRDPSHEILFNVAQSAPRGQKIIFLSLMMNFSVGADGKGAAECSIKLTRPDGKVATEKKDFPCVSRRVLNPAMIYPSSVALGFVGDPDDPLGVWTFESTAKDLVSGVKTTSVVQLKLVAAAPIKP